MDPVHLTITGPTNKIMHQKGPKKYVESRFEGTHGGPFVSVILDRMSGAPRLMQNSGFLLFVAQ